MENNNKGCVYFFRHVGLSPVKIGFSDNSSPIDRFNSFTTYAPFGAELVGFIITDKACRIEKELHRKYKSKRLKGEWFEISDEEVNKEISFYSSIEAVRDKNDFQIEYAKRIAVLNKEYFEECSPTKKALCFKLINDNSRISKSEIARILGVSRQTVYDILKSDN